MLLTPMSVLSHPHYLPFPESLPEISYTPIHRNTGPGSGEVSE